MDVYLDSACLSVTPFWFLRTCLLKSAYLLVASSLLLCECGLVFSNNASGFFRNYTPDVSHLGLRRSWLLLLLGFFFSLTPDCSDCGAGLFFHLRLSCGPLLTCEANKLFFPFHLFSS
ncbi:hypothetical protein TNCT_252021 [Trichonephila clavata]|uniref:Uncharacterized protein n=1 Tax=Trichonephila clavata TaxID=2740835 RepID=A0A8X6K998_TRICU|nr:hypothetical protein TNCT_252021 [Trichonephila clavata]